jgi:hypothetical protein
MRSLQRHGRRSTWPLEVSQWRLPSCRLEARGADWGNEFEGAIEAANVAEHQPLSPQASESPELPDELR